MKNISIQAGKGLGFNDNKLTTAIAESSLITKRPDGIFVGNLTGNPGQGGGTNGCDNHTVIPFSNACCINRNVVQFIFAMSAWKVTNRTVGNYTINPSAMKSKADVINEFNAVLTKYGYTSYNIFEKDLMMFRHNPTPLAYTGWTETIDDGNRYPSTPCLALFVVDSISKPSGSLWVNDITLKCVWRTDDDPIIASSLSVGTILL